MKKDINWMLIESVVRRTVQKLHDSPEREIRNLIDLGLSFADGRFQRKFLKASQKMLRNEKSAYYPLIKDVVSHVDEERLVPEEPKPSDKSSRRRASIFLGR